MRVTEGAVCADYAHVKLGAIHVRLCQRNLRLGAVVSGVRGHGNGARQRAQPQFVQCNVGAADGVAVKAVEPGLRQRIDGRAAAEPAAPEATAPETAASETPGWRRHP